MKYNCCHSWKLVGKDIYQCDLCKISSNTIFYESEFEHECVHSWKIIGQDEHLGYIRTISENSLGSKETLNEIYQCEFCKITN